MRENLRNTKICVTPSSRSGAGLEPGKDRKIRDFVFMRQASLILALILTLAMSFGLVSCKPSTDAPKNKAKEPHKVSLALSGKVSEEFQQIFTETTEKIAANELAPKFGLSAWQVIGLAKAGKLTDNLGKAYTAKLQKSLTALPQTKPFKLSEDYASNNCREILALLACGDDPAAFDGKDLYAALHDFTFVKSQGTPGIIWTLVAFDATRREFATPSEKGATSRESLLAEIKASQLGNGAFGVDKKTADIDMTAMTLTALSPYKDDNAFRDVISKALAYLSDKQDPDGGYTAYNYKSSETISQVIIALSSLGIDIAKDERFVKDGNLWEALQRFYLNDGTFCHVREYAKTDVMATEQAYLAMVAYASYLCQENCIYDFVYGK